VSLADSPRAEIVGSLKRPARLIDANRRVYVRGHTAVQPEERARGLDEVHVIADEEIPRVVQRQVDIGLDVVSDGELRRQMFLNSLFDGVEGFTTDRSKATFRGDDGSTVDQNMQLVVDRLRKVDSPGAREAAFMARTTDRLFKVAFPAGSFLALPFSWRADVNGHAYPTHRSLVEHAVQIEMEMIAETVAAGARYIQLDFPSYVFLCDPEWSARIERAGFDRHETLSLCEWADREVVSAVPDGVRTALHICRGNNQSRYVAAGALEDDVAEVLFSLPYDSFLVEWEDPTRMGGFDALRHVPSGDSVIVLGLVSSKHAELEPADEIIRRIDDAARFVDLERLALSPQCGFASTLEGNELTEDDQWRKLELVASVANHVWG
jgi:5-methyltetrahydropteroyltriglutamate--homocysteine methyltransferase